MSLYFKIRILAIISCCIPFNLLAQFTGTSCAAAVNVPINSCSSSATFPNTPTVSIAFCNGTSSDTIRVERWFTFTTLSSAISAASTTISIVTGAGLNHTTRNLAFELYSGTCASLVYEGCENSSIIDNNETAVFNLLPSTTYFVRVVNLATSFTPLTATSTRLCIYEPPAEDVVEGAMPLTVGGGTCNYTAYSSISQTVATNASGSGTDCWANPCGTYNAGSNDVWFSTFVPPSGEFFINTKGNSPTQDYAMAVYSSSICATASILGCSTTNPEGLSGTVNFTKMPTLYITGAVPNSTVYIRVWKETGTIQNFSICVNDMGPCGNLPNNDFCSNPISISTSGASPGDVAYNATGMTYTTDKPGDLQTTTQYSTSPCKAPTNNAWYSFVATSADAASGLTIPFTYVAPCTGALSATLFSVTTNSYGCCKEFTAIACPTNSTASTGFDLTVPAGSLTAGVTYYLMVNSLTSTCQFSITGWSIAGTLPVNFMSFLSENEGKYNVINWQTNTDYNVSTYLLERSYDAMSFEPVAEIKSSQQYNGNKYVVRDVGMKHTDIIYYRVRVLTLSGEKKYSNIISLNLNSLYESILNLHPNPTTADLNFEYYLKHAGNIQVSLVDYAGKIAFDATYQLTEGKNKLTLPMSSLENGVYILKVVAEKSGKTTYNKVVKN